MLQHEKQERGCCCGGVAFAQDCREERVLRRLIVDLELADFQVGRLAVALVVRCMCQTEPGHCEQGYFIAFPSILVTFFYPAVFRNDCLGVAYE